MAKWQYSRGLHDLGNNTWAWLQPDGGWGLSNAGLVVDGGQTLLVDTLFDLAHTREMLDAYARAAPAAATVDVLINTHSNGDHTFGNQLVKGARIIASRSCAEEMAQRRPEERTQVMREHVEMLYRHYGDEAGLRIARKHVGWYLEHLPHGRALRAEFNRLATVAAQTHFLHTCLQRGPLELAA